MKNLLHNGKTIDAKDVKVGDLLMGVDSRPRKVLAIHKGMGTSYEIAPISNRAEPFVVDAEHMLHLVATKSRVKKPIKRLTVKEYLTKKEGFKAMNKLTRAVVSSDRECLYNAYILGIIQSLGSIREGQLYLNRVDFRLLGYLKDFCRIYNFSYSIENYLDYGKEPRIRFTITENVASLSFGTNRAFELIEYDILECRLSDRYKYLAGVFDATSCKQGSKREIIHKRSDNFKQIELVCRSVGFGSYRQRKGTNNEFMAVTGDLNFMPTNLRTFPPRKSPVDMNRVNFKIKKIGTGEYINFTVDRDNLYVTSDYIIHGGK